MHVTQQTIIIFSVLILALLGVGIIEYFNRRKQPKLTLTVLASSVTSYNPGTNMTSATILATIAITAAYTDAKGNAADAPATPVWTVDKPELATVAASIDGLSAIVTPVGPLGTVVVTATAGSISGSAAIDLTAGPAAAVVLTTTVNEPAAPVVAPVAPAVVDPSAPAA